MILAKFKELHERLQELDTVDNISRHGSIVERELCKLFLKECDEELKYEIYQVVLDTDEITSLMINYQENVSFSTIKLQEHIEETTHREAAMFIDDMLAQVEKDGS